MAELKKLDRWAEKLLDTGKRNNLINFKDSKTSSAEILFPSCEAIFDKCSFGRVFDFFDPKIPDEDLDNAEGLGGSMPDAVENRRFGREEYKALYSSRIRNEKSLLAYAQNPNPITVLKNIAKKAKQIQDETGINVAYLAFGFIRWNEKESSDTFCRAPLLLVHVNILTGSILDPVRIEITDDDVVVNPTFDYFLQAEYGLTLPEYEDGELLSTYYGKVRNVVRGLEWEVLDECKLSVFSFLKINMYEDLKKNSAKILKNENVLALLGEATPDNRSGYGDGAEHVVNNPLIDLHTVVDADSSQIEAIEMAKSGKSFVLQGPPGTGKSQTITNIIAECLHDGKKVLFVSEKQAALNVVFDKLKKAGLADFCLELHSHKANKKAVIDELNRTLEMPKSSVSSNAQEEIRIKEEAQKKLDAYAAELHKKRNNIDKSLYQLFELHSALRSYPDVSFSIRDIQSKGQSYLLLATKLLEQYAEFVPSVGKDYRKNAWYGFAEPKINYEERVAFKADLERLLRGYRVLQATAGRLNEKYNAPELNFSDTKKWQELLAFVSSSDVVSPSLLSREALNYALPHIDAMRESSEVIVPFREYLLETYTPEIFKTENGRELYTKLTGQYGSFFSRMFDGEYKNLLAGLQLYQKESCKLKYQQAVDLANSLMKLQEAEQTFAENETAVPGCLGRCYNGPDTDWTHVMTELDTLQAFFSDEKVSFGSISKMTPEHFAEMQAEFQADSEQLRAEINCSEEVKNRIAERFTKESLDLEQAKYGSCIQKLEGCLTEFDKLANWISFMHLLDQLKDADLISYINQMIEESIDAEKNSAVFQKAFYSQWIENIIFNVPVLASFSRIKQDQAVQSFEEKDRTQYAISKAQIRAELSQQRPNLDLVAGGSAVAILRREGNKKRKQMPIRKLLSETGSLVQIIKPCFLMSPLSVSTFLDPEKIGFDTVIFDEASQIFPQDAVGAIYRGKQLIVVGDSRQMPPSDFFSSSLDIEDDDEDSGDVNDFESILDVCSSVFTTERLAWHYRSHYEQLIAFSNLNFYNNHLVTFPSSASDRKGIGVDYYYVDGVFDRKSKTNRAEAQFIVDLIYKNINEHPNRSLGVVAFSATQQDLIDKLLSKKREENPSYEWFFKADNAEPFFVKNLETVQGDERDTIIFSVAYAKDSQGRWIQNFGPLNREGGERRLNVAVTRAKDNVQLVASIHYSDINLAGTNSEGVRLLRAYLDYAQNGTVALERSVIVSGEDAFDSYFEQEVCDFLRDNGFTVDSQVGCSGYRIDLGLRKPDSSDYFLAIECDGASYHSSKNARDRDSLRQRILENMGWRFYRIWSTDWYRNKKVEKERLLQTVKDALSKDSCIEESAPEITRQEPNSVAEDAEELFVSEAAENPFEFPKYHQLNAASIIRKNNYDFQDMVREILLTEAPLSEAYLQKRVAPFFGREKVSKTVIEKYERLMFRCERKGIIRRNGFLYLQGMADPKLRIPGDRREIKYISLEELADGLYTLIEMNVTANRDGLYKTMTSLLGFGKKGEAIVSRFDQALRLLINGGRVKEDAGILSVNVK